MASGRDFVRDLSVWDSGFGLGLPVLGEDRPRREALAKYYPYPDLKDFRMDIESVVFASRFFASPQRPSPP
ncbi:MAG: hypothetical protein ACQXXL_08565 [Candidatus Methanosuratincola sp.]